MCISVLLPEPDGPMMATISPASIGDVHAAQCLDDVVPAQPVGLAQVASFEECHRFVSPVVSSGHS